MATAQQARSACPTIRGIAFDLDGVILDSIHLKTQAFRRLFAGYPQHQEAIMRLHLENLGTSRYEKFRRIYADLLHLPLPPTEMDRLDQEFGDIVGKEIGTCPYIPGIQEFLQRRAGQQPLFVVSSTPEGELQAILDQHRLTPLFAGVFGAPRPKTESLRRVLSQLDAPPGALLFIGDAQEDLQAAVKVGTRFIGRVVPGAPDPFQAPEVLTVSDFWELEALWSKVARRVA